MKRGLKGLPVPLGLRFPSSTLGRGGAAPDRRAGLKVRVRSWGPVRRPLEVGRGRAGKGLRVRGPFGCPSSSPHGEVCRLRLAPHAGNASAAALLSPRQPWRPSSPPHPASPSIPGPTPLGGSSRSPGPGPARCGPSQRSHEMARARRAARAAEPGGRCGRGGGRSPPPGPRERWAEVRV